MRRAKAAHRAAGKNAHDDRAHAVPPLRAPAGGSPRSGMPNPRSRSISRTAAASRLRYWSEALGAVGSTEWGTRPWWVGQVTPRSAGRGVPRRHGALEQVITLSAPAVQIAWWAASLIPAGPRSRAW